jgi:N-acetylmuramoyl-L-alanine amidase, family 3
MDDSKESQKIRTKEYQQKLVDGIIQGIQQYYNN